MLPDHMVPAHPKPEADSILHFYRNSENPSGYMIDDIYQWTPDKLEFAHDYIQWLFPLPAPSNFNPDAPLLHPDVAKIFRADPELSCKVEDSFYCYMRLLELKLWCGRLVYTDSSISPHLCRPNHNWLRISRVMESCYLLGRADLTKLLWDFLETNIIGSYSVSENTIGFWKSASEGGKMVELFKD